jgi:hypothetical protein
VQNDPGGSWSDGEEGDLKDCSRCKYTFYEMRRCRTGRGTCFCKELELELGLIHTQMTLKPMMRAEEEYACVAQIARAKNRGAGEAKSLTKSEELLSGAHSGNA